MDEHGFKNTRLFESADSDAQAAYTAHESSKPTRKCTAPSEDETLEWMPGQRFEATLVPENPLSLLRPRKRVQEMTSTICAPLLSTFADDNDDDKHPVQINSHEVVTPPAYILNDVGLGDADLVLESEQTIRHWASKCDAFDPLDGSSTNSHTGSDALFYLYLRSPSPAEPPSECSSETLVVMSGEDSSPDPLKKQASVRGSDSEMGQMQEKRHINPKARRIRLRVITPNPRIVLRLTHPKPRMPAEGKKLKNLNMILILHICM